MDDIPLDIQENIIITIPTCTHRIKGPSRAVRVPTTNIWILIPMTMLDPPRLLGHSAHGLAVRSHMKAQRPAESSPGVEATTAKFDSVRGAPQKHLSPLTIKLPNTPPSLQSIKLSRLVTVFGSLFRTFSYFFCFLTPSFCSDCSLSPSVSSPLL